MAEYLLSMSLAMAGIACVIILTYYASKWYARKMGTAAGGNIGDGLSMFEPVHGSAPDIAGTGRANPVAAILSGALMLEHLGEADASKTVNSAVSDFLENALESELPFEFGGKASFEEVGEKIRKYIR